MCWTDHRAQLMLFPIFRVWGTSNFFKSLSEIHWLECDRKEDQVQFCLGHNFSILWPQPTSQTNQILKKMVWTWFHQSGWHFVGAIPKGMLVFMDHKTNHCFKEQQNLSLWKFYTWDRGACKFWICKFDSFETGRVLHFFAFSEFRNWAIFTSASEGKSGNREEARAELICSTRN